MKVYAAYLLLLLACKIHIGHSGKRPKKDPFKYLKRYGYLSAQDSTQMSSMSTIARAFAAEDAIKKFQRYAQLPVTGQMDRATRRKLTGPRCGAQDFKPAPSVANLAVRGVPSFRDMRRKKRYVQQGSRWQKQTLTWSLHSYPSRYVALTRPDVDKTLIKAFKMWQSVSKLNFKKLSNNRQADIIVRFGRGYHGDPYAFDGQGGTLAHGFYPESNTGLAGDIHFDDDETWSLHGQSRTTDLLWTSLHEIGHAIGLEHSDKRDAIMWPWFEGYQPGLKLRHDDISGIQSIYGARYDYTCPATNEVKPKVSSICNYANFDDVIYHKTTCTAYIFRGAYMWRMDHMKQSSNRERISSKWSGLGGYIDAAYSRSDGSIVFFKRKWYYIYDKNFQKIEGPSPLKNFITDLTAHSDLDRIDAAMKWDGNSRVYFFRKNKYWRYNEEKKTIDAGYPKSVTAWPGVQSPVQGVFGWKNSKTFFLHKNNIDKFDYVKFQVKKGRGINQFIRNC